jgi:MFS family permease
MENLPKQNADLGPLRAAGRMLVPLSCGALALLAVVAIIPAIPLIAGSFTRHGVSDGRFLAQMIMIIAGLSSIIGAPAVAMGAKRFGKRPAVLVTLMLFALSGGIGIFQPGFVTLLLSRIVLGFAGGGLGMLGLVLITDYYHGPLRFRLLGVSGTVGLAAAILALVLCGALVDRFGWGAAFAIYPASGLLTWIVAWFCITEPEIPAADQGQSSQGAFGMVNKLTPVYPIYLLVLIFVFGQFTIAIEGPFLLVKIGVLKAASQGLITAIPNMTAMVSSLFFGYLYARLSERQIVTPIVVIVGAGIAAIAFSNSVLEIAVYYAIIGLASGIIIPAAATMVIARAIPGTREPALGMILSVVGVGQFLNPIVTAPITRAFGIRGTFCAVGVVLLVTSAVMILGPFGRKTIRLEHTEEIVDRLAPAP